MEKDENGENMVETVKDLVVTSAYRYTKEELMEIKELPISNERPECLSEKYDSDGVWDPEKWHASLYPSSENSCPAEGYKKDYAEDRVPLKRRIADPRERVKDDDLEVVLSPQRRSFGSGCQVAPTALPRCPISPLENKENESLRLGGARRIGSGRIIASRVFERDARVDKERERDREREFKDKRFRRDFGDKRVFSERRRNDSYAEEEPEWFSGGPTSQSETIELIGFDDKILEDDKRRTKRSRKKPESIKEVECNGGLSGDPEVVQESGADQEVPHAEVLPEQTPGEFDFNEFFNLEKTMPGLASMIEDVLAEGPVMASRFSRWFSSNRSPSGSRSSSLRSTPHEELERLAGLDPHTGSLNQGTSLYFTPISSVERKEKVDILELLHKANIDLKPLLSSLNVNKAHLKESTNSGVVLSLEEVEGSLKALKVQPEPAPSLPQKQPSRGGGTPFMVEHLEKALTEGTGVASRPRDPDMSAFNKLVSTMKASGTLPTHPKASGSSLQQQSVDPALVSLSETQVPTSQQKNIFQELLVAPHGPVPAPVPGLIHQRTSPPLFPQRAPIQDFFPGMPPATGFPVGPQTVLDQIPDMNRARNTPQMRVLPMGVDQTNLEALFQQDLAALNRQQYQQGYNKQAHDKVFRNRQTRMNHSPGPHLPGRASPANTITSVLSPSFTPTSVIKKMYESKEKSRDDPGSRPGSKEETVNSHNSQEDGPPSPSSFLEDVDTSGPQTGGVKACSTPVPTRSRHSKDPDRPRPPSTTGHTPTMLSPGPSSPFPRPQMYPVPLLPHVPLVRPPPQLYPGVMQRMLAQGIQPQQLGPTLLQTGMFPQAVDLSQLQGLPPALLGQPLYPLGPAGHPLMTPRAAGTHMQLAVMQQQLQQQQRPNLPVAPLGGPQSQSYGPHWTNHSQRRGGSPPLGLAKWFGSDVLQQPLPSMPSTKVISVDELEFRQ
ncbi:eukaryotic translation initiation factor 4E transporter-like isoform X1 [Sinocyclocheilus anshuiensis]|uniref:Eukaryotic translation initiation factor 4E transporter-like n=1 Tax=Sinocyclocheilus anshuiensis TaxID=1608454 RepID=A0A671N1E3_9TELE|nr:PREDICTED: eukaryotic translation initiation factor 4E transporter-like isoform X1 [Sinocyclocheilus anshuiensis]XP_016314479.1 PREDICTED: eukaryotic translation initiation factor 4E transporter-like isoform X1 [Sinocyclocheilus anshuiensis]